MGRRTVVCKTTKDGKTPMKKSCFYVVRTKLGHFKKWTNIGKSLAADKRVRSKTRPKKPGYGHRGDYKRRR